MEEEISDNRFIYSVQSRQNGFRATINSYSDCIFMLHARYDSNGDIILERGDDAVPTHEVPVGVRIVDRVERETRQVSASTWTLVGEENRITSLLPTVDSQATSTIRQAHRATPSALSRLSEQSKHFIRKSAAEGASQLTATIADTRDKLREVAQLLWSLPQRVRGTLEHFWRNANTPVTLPGFCNPGRKPPTKLKLFATDTIRFGGTFAAIFIILFVSINYQSFWSIAKAELAIGSDVKTEQALQQITSGTAGTKEADADAKIDAIVRWGDDRNLLSYLPSVGPHEDRLIIPKLGKNVPIVRPSMDALMREDWKQFEKDIQTSLRDGVVHYPGSAKPGQAGNFFITGHSSYYPWYEGDYKDVFARLHELAAGDTYSVYYGGDLHTYRITGKKEVKPSDVSVLDQPTNKRTATLMTCTPVGTTLRRLIVSAEEIDPATGLALQAGEKADEHRTPVARLESLPI